MAYVHLRRLLRRFSSTIKKIIVYWLIPDKWYLTWKFKRMFGRPIDWKNPRSFNEKINWLKIYDRNPLYHKLIDKLQVKSIVTSILGEGYVIPTLASGFADVSHINKDELPDKFVLKCNHGCGYNIIVKDKSKLDLAYVKEKLDYWMRQNFAFKFGTELQYRDIEPKIVIEKYIENTKSDGDLYDYKFWCFNGKVKYIQFLSERNTNGLKMAFYDKKWRKQHFVYSHPLDQKSIEKPSNLKEMIKLAEKLSAGFNHVRVDFYRLDNGQIYFGEMTFTSASGMCKWNDENINQYFGDLFKLPKMAYNINNGAYYKVPKHRIIKPYLLFPYYFLANIWLRNISLPLAKFKKHIKQVMYSHSRRGQIDKLNAKIDNIAQSVLNISTRTDSVIQDVEKIGVFYTYDNQTNWAISHKMTEITNVPDFESRFMKLITGLPFESKVTITNIIARLQMIKDGKHHDLFNNQEKLLLKQVSDFENSILKISDNKFWYNDYLLPINHFEPSVFFYKHGLDKLDNIKYFQSKAILDVGAFIGDSALILSPLTKNKVYCFEGCQKNYDYLNQTIQMNNLKNIVPVKSALGDYNGEIELFYYGGATSVDKNMVKKSTKSEKTQIMRLDDYVREHKINVGLIKVDIEGAEQSFLRGARKTIEKYKPTLLISIYHNVDDFLDIKPMIESWNLGYKFKVFKPTIGSVSAETLLICEQ